LIFLDALVDNDAAPWDDLAAARPLLAQDEEASDS